MGATTVTLRVKNLPMLSGFRNAMKIADSVGQIRISTPYGEAAQEMTREALAARTRVTEGTQLYRLGTRTRSQTGRSAQFWSLEHPNTPGYSHRYGIPQENITRADFIETATLKSDTKFVTRTAPPVGQNPGGGIEIVVPEGGVTIGGHSSL